MIWFSWILFWLNKVTRDGFYHNYNKTSHISFYNLTLHLHIASWILGLNNCPRDGLGALVLAITCSWTRLQGPRTSDSEIFSEGDSSNVECILITLPVTIPDIQQRITNFIAKTNHDILNETWQKVDYRLDIFLVTRGSHIENSWLRVPLMKLFEFSFL